MARKPNYDFEKRKKELDRKAKKDAKKEEKLRRKREQGTTDGHEGDGDATSPAADDASVLPPG